MNLSRICSYVLILIGSLLFSGCASWTPPIAKNEVPTANDTYLYGKFKIDAPKAFMGIDGHQTMGFAFSCNDNKKYTIRFGIDQPIQVIKLTPATCSLAEIIFTNADGEIRARNPAPKGIFTDMVLKPGLSYYIGDYFATSQNTPGFNSVRTTWGIKEVRNQYAATTDEMKLLYPNMANFPTINQLVKK